MLVAEPLLDGALSYALCRKIRGADSPHWLASAPRRTALPFLLTGGFVAISGAAMAVYAPTARSIGQIIQHTHNARSPWASRFREQMGPDAIYPGLLVPGRSGRRTV